MTETGCCRWRGVLGAAVVFAATMIVGCGGGGTDSDVDDEPLTPTLPEIAGVAADGMSPPGRDLLVGVKGNVGTARTAGGRFGVTPGRFLVSLDALSGPYLLKASSVDFSGGVSVASGPGHTNITPLTTLVVAQLLGRDPFAYYDGLLGRGGFTEADDAGIATATERVRRILERDYGYVAPVVDWFADDFEPLEGDAMYEALGELQAALSRQGTDVRSAAVAIGEESARCKTEQVNVANGALVDAFCPSAKSSEPDPSDQAIDVFRFENRRGEVLLVRARGGAVLAAVFSTADDEVFSCAAASCVGLQLGAPAGDLTRRLSLTDVTLRQGTTSVVLSGTLQTAEPGVPLPSLPCARNRYYLVSADRTVQGYCARPDDFGLGAAGRSQISGSTRRLWTFDGDNDSGPGPSLEVVTEGNVVLRVLVYSADPVTGSPIALWQCRDGGCRGVTFGPVRVDESLGVPIELRSFSFGDVVLQAVLPDGSLSNSDTVTLTADLTGIAFNDPSLVPLQPMPCASGTTGVEVIFSDESSSLRVCAPEDTQGFPLSGTVIDPAVGTLVLYVQNLLTDGLGSYTTGNPVSVTVEAGVVRSVTFDSIDGPSYRCDASACGGVSVTPPDTQGRRTITFDDTPLREIGTGGLPTDRTVSLTSSFLAPAP